MEANLYRYILRRSLWRQLMLTAIIFGLAFLNPVTLDLKKQILKKVGKLDLEAVLWLSAMFLGAVLAAGALKYVKQNFEGMIQETMLRDLRSELYHRILRFPLQHVRNTSAGQLISMMIGEVEDLGQFFGEAISVPLFHGLMLLGSAGYMIFLNPMMGLVGLALFPLQIWLVPKLQRRVSLLARERVRLVRGVSDRIQESVGGIQEIYANDTVAFEANTFRNQLSTIFRVRIRIYNLKYLVKWINNFLEKLGYCILLIVGGWIAVTRPGSGLDVASLVVLLDAYSQLNEPWRELINYFQNKETARIKYEQVIASFDPPGLRAEFPLEEKLPEPLPTLAGAYELRNASVVLDGGAPILDRLQLSTPPHQLVAVVGTPGSGKSTFTMVLAKLYGYTGTVLLDSVDLAQLPSAVAGRQIAYVGSEAKLFTGTVFENLVYGLRHRPAASAGGDGVDAGPEDWLDLSPVGAADRAGLIAAMHETARLVTLDDDLFFFGLRATIDPEKKPEVARRALAARRLVMERFERERGEVAVEFFDRERFSMYASVGENILFGYSAAPELAPERLADHEHFRRVIAEVGMRDPLLSLGAEVAREMVEIFKDIPADHELFANFSLITASELPEYTPLAARLERTTPGALTQEDQRRLITLALRLIPARHRLGRIDEEFMARVVAARKRFAETLPPALARAFEPYDRERYFANGTLLENMLFGKTVATSSLAVKKVNAIVEEVITTHGLREVVIETGLDYHAGIAGSRLSPAQRQKVALTRALLKRPNILILDEAMSALEPEKRPEMHHRITEAMKGRAVIAVVERPDLARYYDRVVVLDSGKVSEAGTYDELAGRDGLFRHLVAQASVTA
jgi:ABC-type multidrug transport system fused ATPase/permease subunit